MGGEEVVIAPAARAPTPAARAIARRALIAAAWFAALGAAFGSGLVVCPTAFFFHLPCPGCGLTRAALRLAHADLAGAVSLHPLSPLLVPLAAALALTNTWVYVKSGVWGFVESFRGRGVNATVIALFALTFGVWVARFFGAFGGPVAV